MCDRMRICWLIGICCLGLLVPASLGASRRLVAFSLSEAGRRLRRDDGNDRQQLDQLGGITRLLAICPDKDTGDWILVGQDRPDCPPISIELLVDTFKVVGSEGIPWPVVSINFTEETEATGLLQVQFKGGSRTHPLETSRLGQVLVDMDVFLKQYSLELEAGGALSLEEAPSYRRLRIDKLCELCGFQDPVVEPITQARRDELTEEGARPLEAHNAREYRFWFKREEKNQEWPGTEGYGIHELLLRVCKRNIPVADDFLRRESDQREDGLRRTAFHPEKSNRLKYIPLSGNAEPTVTNDGDGQRRSRVRDEAADEFARGFTLHFEKLAEKHPRLKYLKMLYDLTALSRFMANEMGRGVFPVSPNVRYLFHQHPLEPVEARKKIAVQDLCFHIRDRADRDKAAFCAIRGGIDMKVENAKQKVFDGSVNGLTELAKLSRPKPDSLSWRLPPLGDWRHPNQATTSAQFAAGSGDAPRTEVSRVSDDVSPAIPGRDAFRRNRGTSDFEEVHDRSASGEQPSTDRPKPPESLFPGTGVRVEVFELGSSRNADLFASNRPRFDASMVKPLGGVFINPATWTDDCLLPGSVHKDIVEAVKTGRREVDLDLGDDAFAKAFGDRLFRLISLRELGRDMRSRRRHDLCEATRLHGFAFIKDERGGDCVLITSVEGDNRPALNVDDLVVALRNVIDGRRFPACTINPRPDTLRRLNSLESTVTSYSGNMNAFKEEYERIARSDQDVLVYGINPDNHFGNVMVMADYRMKKISNGSDNVTGLTSLWDLFDRLDSPAGEICNRFWFNPKEEPVLFREDNHGVVMFLQAAVRLSTEEEVVTQFGSTHGKGAPHPLAKEFADDFTKQYEKIALERPIYRELQNVFQWMAVVNGMWKTAQHRGRTALIRRFLRETQIESVDTPDALAGVPLVRVHQSGSSIGMRASVGGVKVAMQVDLDRHRKQAPQTILREYARAIANKRPHSKSVYWDINTGNL
ncbi:MAG: DUF1598 domain-containing protein [Pirellulaceae bacterium]